MKISNSKHIKEMFNISNSLEIYHQKATSFYIEEALKKSNAKLSANGSLLVDSTPNTGRRSDARYIVEDSYSQERINWNGGFKKLTKDHFNALKNFATNELSKQNELYSTTREIGRSGHEMKVFVLTPSPSHILFCHNMFIESEAVFSQKDDFKILHLPHTTLELNRFGNDSDAMIVTSFEEKMTIIVGTAYAGEIKKSMFSVMNTILLDKGVMPMHTGASETQSGQSSLFFGLSGTGKTTLSTDTQVKLIGDDEHGMDDKGIFNFENGCYAKTYKLSHESEPEIFKASNSFGSMIENVTYNEENREIDFFNKDITENGRSSYPLSLIPNRVMSGTSKLPKDIFFLTADAFGVLPALAKLTPEQTHRYFLLGYTAKLAGTEVGLKEPEATFSACFGSPFMLCHPTKYADLLMSYVKKHNINVWLVNTGWHQASYPEGSRYPLSVTRALIRSVQSSVNHDKISFERDPIFNLSCPLAMDGVEAKYLKPNGLWKNQAEYDQKAKKLKELFDQQIGKYNLEMK